MQLFEERKVELIQILQKKAPQLSCPMCHSRHFTLSPGYFLNLLQKDVEGNINYVGESIPSFSIICTNCGFISQHSIGVLGLLSNDSGNDISQEDKEKNDE